MERFIMCPSEYMSVFANKNLNLKSFDDYRDIPVNSEVLLIDADCSIGTAVVTDLILKACSLYYVCIQKNLSIMKLLVSKASYNLYQIDSLENLTVSKMEEMFNTRLTAEDAQKILNNAEYLGNDNLVISSVSKFLELIQTKDREGLISWFDDYFEDVYSNFSKTIESILLERDSLTRETIQLKKSVQNAQMELTKHKESFRSLAEAGKKLEEASNALSRENKSQQSEIITLKGEKEQIQEDYNNATLRIQELNKDNIKLKEENERVLTKYNETVANNDKLTQDIEKLSSSLSSIKQLQSEDIQLNVNITNLEKIVYVKILDMMPDLVDTFEKYARSLSGTLSKEGCTLFLVNPESTIKDQINNSIVISDRDFDKEIFNSSMVNKIFVCEGFKNIVDDLIRNADVDILVVIDMTLKNKVMLKSAKVKYVYGIHSIETAKRYTINPAECFSDVNLSDDGVSIAMPSKNEDTKAKRLIALNNDFYKPLTNIWR